MLIAFWNINTGRGSFRERIQTFGEWCTSRRPHLLFLEEVSHTLADDLPALTGMRTLGFVNTLDKNQNASTKQLHALARRNIRHDYKCRAVRFPNLKSKRALLKVSAVDGDLRGAAIWTLHANASARGGSAAVTAVKAYLATNPDAIVGGDFNYAVAQALPEAVAPRSWVPNNLRLTQWNKRAGATSAPNPRLHLVTGPPFGPVIYAEIVPHRVIDYVMAGGNRVVTSAANCPDEAIWKRILTCFDHCPVVYNVT